MTEPTSIPAETTCEYCGCACKHLAADPNSARGRCTEEPMHSWALACMACDCECCLDDGCEDEDEEE